jgi:phage shock protein C
MKRLYRDKSNEMIAGVCSGIANYLDVDATVIRLVFVLFTFIGGGGLWIYIILAIIMPVQPESADAVSGEEKISMLNESEVEKAQEVENTPAKKTPARKPVQKSKAPAKKPAAKSSGSSSAKKTVEKKQSTKTKPAETPPEK